jgi:dTDP-4-amino-4,6-dideoxygalactose transaminase
VATLSTLIRKTYSTRRPLNDIFRLMNVPLLDLRAQYAPLQVASEAAALKVLREGRYVLGPEVGELECELAGYLGVKHVVTCASGSDALLLALMALGISTGDEVITTPFTFFATVSAITRLGARPVFVDIDPATFNIQVSSLQSQVSSRTKAIIPVHLFGQCADMEPLMKLGVPIVEDACQAIGAKYQGKMAGALGTMGTFSFYPTKNLGGAGDGGALSTDDTALATKLRQLRNHGMEPRYYHAMIGINSRLDTMQAALLRVKLPHLDAWAEGRRRNAARYTELFSPISQLQTPISLPHCHHVFNQYTIRVARRDALREHLKTNGIATEIYYPVPVDRQQCYAYLGHRPSAFPQSERAAAEVISLPVHPELTSEQIDYVAKTVAEFVQRT